MLIKNYNIPVTTGALNLSATLEYIKAGRNSGSKWKIDNPTRWYNSFGLKWTDKIRGIISKYRDDVNNTIKILEHKYCSYKLQAYL